MILYIVLSRKRVRRRWPEAPKKRQKNWPRFVEVHFSPVISHACVEMYVDILLIFGFLFSHFFCCSAQVILSCGGHVASFVQFLIFLSLYRNVYAHTFRTMVIIYEFNSENHYTFSYVFKCCWTSFYSTPLIFHAARHFTSIMIIYIINIHF